MDNPGIHSARMLRLDPHFRIPGHHLGLGLGLRNHGDYWEISRKPWLFPWEKCGIFLDIMRYYIYIIYIIYIYMYIYTYSHKSQKFGLIGEMMVNHLPQNQAP